MFDHDGDDTGDLQPLQPWWTLGLRLVVGFLALLAAPACKTEGRKWQEVENCSAVTGSFPGAGPGADDAVERCLILTYHWNAGQALSAVLEYPRRFAAETAAMSRAERGADTRAATRGRFIGSKSRRLYFKASPDCITGTYVEIRDRVYFPSDSAAKGGGYIRSTDPGC